MTAPYWIRGLQYLSQRYLMRRPYLTAETDTIGFPARFKFKIEDGGGRCIYKRGVYEPHLTQIVRDRLDLKPNDVVLDIGANIGWYSVLFSRMAPQSVRVFAFEPDPLNYRLLCENITINNATTVQPFQLALASESGVMTLHKYPAKNCGRHSLLPINDGEQIDVQTVRLDDFLAEQNIDPERVKFVKIDVEGYELEVFRGAQSLLNAGPTILAEYAPGYMQQGGLDPQELFGLFEQSGYHCEDITDSEGTHPTTDDLLKRETNADLYWSVRGPEATADPVRKTA